MKRDHKMIYSMQDMRRAERLRKIKQVVIDLTLAALAVGMWGALAYFASAQLLGG